MPGIRPKCSRRLPATGSPPSGSTAGAFRKPPIRELPAGAPDGAARAELQKRPASPHMMGVMERTPAVANGSVPNSTYQAYPSVDPRWTEGTLGRRAFAYLVDVIVIALVSAVLWVLIGILGVITLGLGWMLFALLPLTAILYNAITILGSSQGTVGMRMTGVRGLDATGGGSGCVVVAAGAAPLV